MSLALAVTVALAASPSAASLQKSLQEEVDAWHQKRLDSLRSAEGWLSLVGLHWLEPGENPAGSADGNKLVLPKTAPGNLATFTLHPDGTVTAKPAPGVELRKNDQPFTGGKLLTDADAKPDVLSVGTYRMHLIRRGDRVGLRVKDAEAPARVGFKGIERYPVSAQWKVEAKWEPSPQPRKIAVPTVLGTVEEMTSYGAVVFEVDGKQHRLYPVQDTPESNLFLIFADRTNRDETYGAGRFLYASPPKDGKVTLDFNRSYNPPCAFSAYATCPLPPKDNRLKVRIPAGEKRYAGK